MPLRLSPGFLERLDFGSAVDRELERPPDRLPSRVVDKAVDQHRAEYAARIAGHCESGFDPAREEIVWMPKARLSYRPLTALPLRERVVYRALGVDFESSVTSLDAFRNNQDSFESDLIADDEDEEIQYIVIADVVSFYRYVPHALLHKRLIETTGRADLADAVRSFLQHTMESDIGLPQNLGPSDLFADVILTPVERRLLRAGLPTTRSTMTSESAQRHLRKPAKRSHAFKRRFTPWDSL